MCIKSHRSGSNSEVSLCSGRFYAPEQPGERVLSLSSNQNENTLLVSGDTSGRLQIWNIGHFGLHIQAQVSRSLQFCVWWLAYI